MTTIITGIQTGASTHHQLQSITPISFRTIKNYGEYIAQSKTFRR